MGRPEFALVNGGNKDLLITALQCGFEYRSDAGAASFWPAQTIEHNEGDSFYLEASKAFHCLVTLTDDFTSSFVKKGVHNTIDFPNLYFHKLVVWLEWVDDCGHEFKKKVAVEEYGFDEECNIRRTNPLEKRHDLYSAP